MLECYRPDRKSPRPPAAGMLVNSTVLKAKVALLLCAPDPDKVGLLDEEEINCSVKQKQFILPALTEKEKEIESMSSTFRLSIQQK